ncbi:hypothetical protein EG329_009612 [Mollisiaceae sp. DMI_Dod_QoI]|nr:hypothetical protein EG329_009612 [Helotiales sp. DMI_Dod_QoI]
MGSGTDTAVNSNMATNTTTPSRGISYTRDPPDRLGQISDLQQYHDLTNELQNLRTSQQDVATELRIRVTVLENELEHARKEKDSGLNSLRIVIESLTGNTSSTTVPRVSAAPLPVPQASIITEDTFRQTKQFELERLRKENRSLRSKVKELERADNFRGRSRERNVGFESPERLQNRVRRESGWAEAEDGGKGKEKVSDPIPTNIEYKGLRNVPTGPRNQTLRHPEEGPTASMLIGSWGCEDSFDRGLPTIPNTPIIAATNLASFDVGLYSLEDNLNDNGLPPPIAPQAALNNEGFPEARIAQIPSLMASQSVTETKSYPELDKGIDEQLADEGATMLKFKGPTPGVLKTGFQLEGNRRGDDYDASNRLETARTYNRSQCLWRDPNTASSSNENFPVGPGAAFEMPNDRSFDSNLWSSVEEREEVIQANMQLVRGSFARKAEERAFPDFFRYGIQYRPDATDSNYARTVHINNLPENTELREVIARVRGGEILGATLLNTVKLTGGMTARVVFKLEGAAEDYALYAAEHPITFGENKRVAQVILIDTPTYPLNAGQHARVRAGEQTRCLAIPDFPRTVSIRGLERTLACGNGYRAESLVELFQDEFETLHLEFSSVDIAGSAYGILTSRRLHGSSPPRFEPDPCAGPVEELEHEVSPRPPLFFRSHLRQSSEESFDSSERDEGDERIFRELESLQRKRLAALSNQKVEIPSFSGTGIKSASWADEVIDEAEDDSKSIPLMKEDPLLITRLPDNAQEAVDNGKDCITEKVNLLTMNNINQMMAEARAKPWEDRKRPIGLAGSKYASFLPDFEDRGERPRLGRGWGTAESFTRRFNDNNNDEPRASTRQEIRHTEEVARREEAQSEYAFNTYRHGSTDNLAVQAPELDPHQVFHSNPLIDFESNEYSRSPPRVDLQDLLAFSESSKSRSPSPSIGFPTQPGQLGPFGLSFLNVATPSSRCESDVTAKFVTAHSVSQEKDGFWEHPSEEREDRVRKSPNSPIPREVVIPEGLQHKKNASFEVPPVEKMHSLLFERRKGLGLMIDTSLSGMKRKRERAERREKESDVDAENLAISTDDILDGAEAAEKSMNVEVGTLVKDSKDLVDMGKGKEVMVANPDEISLDEEDE